MNQFNSEIEANESRAKLDGLSRAGVGAAFAFKLLGLVQRLINPASEGLDNLSESAADLVLSLREDREHRSLREVHYLLESVVLEVKRHDCKVDSLQDRVSRLEAGIQAAMRYPTDGRNETIRRVAIVIVRGAFTFPENPQEQTDEFLRIASQITDSEISLLRVICESQAGLAKVLGKVYSPEIWLSQIQRLWGEMNAMHKPSPEQWMHRKSALVRLQGYGFLEQVERVSTAQGSEVGQSPYALLPLGRDFCDYTNPA
jgi:hypothetical protein